MIFQSISGPCVAKVAEVEKTIFFKGIGSSHYSMTRFKLPFGLLENILLSLTKRFWWSSIRNKKRDSLVEMGIRFFAFVNQKVG